MPYDFKRRSEAAKLGWKRRKREERITEEIRARQVRDVDWIIIKPQQSIDITPIITETEYRTFRPINPVSIQRQEGEAVGYVFIEYRRIRVRNNREISEDREWGSPHNIRNLTEANYWLKTWYINETQKYPNSWIIIDKAHFVNRPHRGGWGKKITEIPV